MCARNVGLGLLTMFLLASGGGCRKSPLAPATAAPVETVARLHWLGIQRLARDTNATDFLSVWNLPESKQLAAQTLDKLALALTGEQPGGGSNRLSMTSNQLSVTSNQLSVTSNQLSVTSNRLSAARSPASITNRLSTISTPLAVKLRPLLEDMVQAEAYVELRQATNQPEELALAVRLSDEQAGAWETNLAAVLERLSGSRAVAGPAGGYGWAMQVTNRPASAGAQAAGVPRQVELIRAGDWTLVGLAAGSNGLVRELRERIRREGGPGSARATNYWVEAEVDLGRLGCALKVGQASPPALPTSSAAGGQAGTPALLSWPAGLPKLAVTVSGDGGAVRTAGELKFPQSLPFEDAAWNIPTNLVHQPLISFTAIRGFRPWLESQNVWKQLGLGAAPGQVCFWALQGLPFLSYGAAPLADASNCVARLTERLLNEGNAWVSTNARTSFLRLEYTNGVEFTAPFMTPYLQSAHVGGSDYVLGGLVRQGPGKNPLAPPALFHEVTRRTNLVAYDWELTGPRLDAWLHTSQQFRMLLFRDQLLPDSAAVKAFLGAAPRLGNCVTAVTLTAPDQLSFVRRSAIGFTSVELNLLADWLESPQFPRGFYSRARQLSPLRAKSRFGTNSVPPPRPP